MEVPEVIPLPLYNFWMIMRNTFLPHIYERTSYTEWSSIHRFLMLTSMFPTTHAATKTANTPATMVIGLRIPSQSV